MNEPTTRPPPPELKRLDSTTRSPIYGQFSELLQGLDTVRALREQSHFATRFAAAVDTHTRAELYLWMCNRWLVIRLQCLSATIAVAIGAYVLFFNQGTVTLAVPRQRNTARTTTPSSRRDVFRFLPRPSDC